MRRWITLTAFLVPAILFVWLQHAGGQTAYTAAIHHPGGAQSIPAASGDANQDAWPDDPFAALIDGDLWLASTATRTVAALRWQGLGGTGFQPVVQIIDLNLLRPDLSTQRLLVEAPNALAEIGEIAILLIGAAPDLESLLGSEAAGIAIHDDWELLPGGQYIEISVLISDDGGTTFDEIDPARVENLPIRLRIEDLTAPVDAFPVLYEHPTYIDSHPQVGLTPLAESGAWTPTSCVTLPHDDRAPEDETYPAYLEAELRSLSVFAPMVPSSDDNGGEGTTTGGPGGNPVDSSGGPGGSGPMGTFETESGGEELGGGDSLEESGDGSGGLALLSSPVVYVDFEYVGTESGTESQPFNSLTEALATVEVNGTIFVAPGVTHETLTEVSKPVTMQFWNVTRQASTDTATVGDITACGPDIDSFAVNYFSNAAALHVSGNADYNGGGVDLVPQQDDKAGAVWTRRKVNVSRGFEVNFKFYLNPSFGTPDNDGISFVIQNSGPEPALTAGGYMGYTGIANSVAVEFDHWQNPETNDPNNKHVSIQSGGLGAANSAIHSPQYQIALSNIGYISGYNTARIVYNPRAQKLSVHLNNSIDPVVEAHSFRLENSMNLDDGTAYIGIVATTGVEADTYGPTYLSVFTASFPQSCEEVIHKEALGFTTFDGYSGDRFDHRVTGIFLRDGDIIQESLQHVSSGDTIGLTEGDVRLITGGANGTWFVRTRNGNLWRGPGPGHEDPQIPDVDNPNTFDEHKVETGPNRESFTKFFNAGGTTGHVTFIQTMRHVGYKNPNSPPAEPPEPGTNAVIARHRLIFRFVKMDPAFTQGGQSCFTDIFQHRYHQIVQKQNASNPNGLFEEAGQPIPQIPCP